MQENLTQATATFRSWRAELSEAARAELDFYERERRLHAGEIMYHFGEEANCGYHILSGMIEINCYSADGREYVMGTMGPGGTIGDVGLVNGGLRFNNAVALTDAKVSILTRDHYQVLIQKHPEISHKMAEVLGYRFQSLFALTQDANLLPLYQRLGRTIVRLTLAQNGKPPRKSITLENCSQEKLGLMVGAVRQSVGREIKRMETAGLIKSSYGRMIVLDFPQMAALFGSVVEYEPMIRTQFGFTPA